MKAKLDQHKIAYRIVWEPGPGDEVRDRVETVKRWFVHDWQTLDNKVKSSIVEGVSVFSPCSICRMWRRCFAPKRRNFPTTREQSKFKPKSGGSRRRRQRRTARRTTRSRTARPDGTNRSRPYLRLEKKRLRARSA